MIETDEAVTTEDIDALGAALSRLDERVDDGERIDQLTALERLKSAVAAAQARVTVEFVASQQHIAEGWREHAKACSENNDFDGWRQARDNAARASLEEPEANQNGNDNSGHGSGSRSRRRGQLTHGITAQVALARHESPYRGSGHVTLALTLSRHLPNVMAWLQTGVLSEWRATLIVLAANHCPRPHGAGPGPAPGSLRSVAGARQQEQPPPAPWRRPRIGRPTPPPPPHAGGTSAGESGIGDGHPTLEPGLRPRSGRRRSTPRAPSGVLPAQP